MTVALEDGGRRLVIRRRRSPKSLVWLAIMISSTAFFAYGSVAMDASAAQRWSFLGVALISAYIVLRWAAMMMPATPLLEADAEGFRFPSRFAATVPWQAISDVAPIRTDLRGVGFFPEGKLWTVPVMLKEPMAVGWSFPWRLIARRRPTELQLKLHEMVWPRTPAGRVFTGEDLRILVRANKRAAARGAGRLVIPEDGVWRYFGLDAPT